MNKNYVKGRRNEYRSVKVLEAAGYTVIRSAGSHGPYDLVGWDNVGFVLVQCKSDEWPSPAERESMVLLPVPANAKKLIHRWDTRAKLPRVQEL